MSLSNSTYEALMREYDMRRQDNMAISDERRAEVYESIPRIKDIDDEMADAAMADFRRRLSGDDTGASLHERIEALKAEKLGLLTGAGYPADYLEPVYDCPDCRDTGYIDGEKCHCLKQAEIAVLYGNSHMGDILEDENFSRFSLDYYSRELTDPSGRSSYEAAREAYEFAREFAAGNYPGENILLYGDAGTGKTFLSHCIASEYLSKAYSVVYVTAFTLTEIFSRKAFDKTSEARKDFDDLFSCDLLIIDDLGTEFTNSFTQPSFFQCINERILNKRSTIISTNLSLCQITQIYTERVSSRLAEHYRFIRLFGEDIRFKKMG